MTRTSHGHHIPLSPTDDEQEPMAVARCGGPTICRVCQRECSVFSHPAGKLIPVPPVTTSDPTGRFAELASRLGLKQETVADLLLSGWTYSESLHDPAKWTSSLASIPKAPAYRGS